MRDIHVVKPSYCLILENIELQIVRIKICSTNWKHLHHNCNDIGKWWYDENLILFYFSYQFLHCLLNFTIIINIFQEFAFTSTIKSDKNKV